MFSAKEERQYSSEAYQLGSTLHFCLTGGQYPVLWEPNQLHKVWLPASIYDTSVVPNVCTACFMANVYPPCSDLQLFRSFHHCHKLLIAWQPLAVALTLHRCLLCIPCAILHCACTACTPVSDLPTNLDTDVVQAFMTMHLTIAEQAFMNMHLSSDVAQQLMGMDDLPTEADLIRQLVHLEPDKRPSMGAVLEHPCLWEDKQCLDLLVDLSNYLGKMGKVRLLHHRSD